MRSRSFRGAASDNLLNTCWASKTKNFTWLKDTLLVSSRLNVKVNSFFNKQQNIKIKSVNLNAKLSTKLNKQEIVSKNKV